ncbi:GAF domain-containing protein [Streptomyces sp. NPDC087300]|uniref:GAF domain-containing protein n=1 Tax=Streptomyces sp. NPDC087300 TaxID=3365780 RepID=UPI003828CF7C
MPEGAETPLPSIPPLLEAVLTVGTDLELHATLQHIVDSAARLTGAGYGTLTVGAAGSGGPAELFVTGARAPARDVIGVPIHVHDEVFGDLLLAHKERGAFTDDDRQLLKVLAGQAGIAIGNARLFETARQRERWIEGAAAVTTALLTGEEAADALMTVADRARILAGAAAGVILQPTEAGGMTIVAAATDGAPHGWGTRSWRGARPQKPLAPTERPESPGPEAGTPAAAAPSEPLDGYAAPAGPSRTRDGAETPRAARPEGPLAGAHPDDTLRARPTSDPPQSPDDTRTPQAAHPEDPLAGTQPGGTPRAVPTYDPPQTRDDAGARRDARGADAPGAAHREAPRPTGTARQDDLARSGTTGPAGTPGTDQPKRAPAGTARQDAPAPSGPPGTPRTAQPEPTPANPAPETAGAPTRGATTAGNPLATSPNDLIGTTIEPGSAVLEQLLGGEPVFIEDSATDPRMTTHVRARFGPSMMLPLRAGGRLIGTLALPRRRGAPAYTAAERLLATQFASQAALALVLADAQQSRQRLAVFEDRDRIARDLHDLVVQRLFATGMMLESTRRRARSATVESTLDHAVDELESTIQEVRTAIFALQQPPADAPTTFRGKVLRETAGAAAVLGIQPSTQFAGAVDTQVTEPVAGHLLAALRRALATTSRRTGVGRVDVTVDARATLPDGRTGVRLTVYDDGATDGVEAGTTVTWQAPL